MGLFVAAQRVEAGRAELEVACAGRGGVAEAGARQGAVGHVVLLAQAAEVAQGRGSDWK